MKANRRLSINLIFLLALMVFIGIPAASMAQESPVPSQYRVKYRSVDRIYLEGGKADGLLPGDRVGLYVHDSLVTVLEVVYASDHSASCKIVSGDTELKAGQMLTVVGRVERTEQEPVDVSSPVDTSVQTNNVRPLAKATRGARSESRVYGSAAIQWMSQHDQTGAGLNYNQSTFRLNLRASNMWSRPMAMVIRTRGQHDDRSRSFSTGASGSDWDNRIYEFSLTYGGNGTATAFQVGRILPRHLSRIGYVDGAAIDFGVGSGWHVGASGGMKPRWQYSSDDVSLQKYGAYFGYENRDRKNLRIDQYVAMAGEYHGNEISRELIDIQGSLNVSNGIWLNNQFEIDINRGWRRDKSGSSFGLSSVYLSARWRMSKHVTFGSTYDTRKNYWTYVQQSIADSLFDDQLRRGARADMNLTLPYKVNFNSQIGYRKVAGDSDPTVSLVFYLSKSGLPTPQTRISLRYSSFNGPSNDGHNYNVRVSQRLGEALSLEAANGRYQYQLASSNESRSNNWWEGVVRLEALRFWYADLLYQNDSGDDVAGYTLRIELGRRF